MEAPRDMPPGAVPLSRFMFAHPEITVAAQDALERMVEFHSNGYEDEDWEYRRVSAGNEPMAYVEAMHSFNAGDCSNGVRFDADGTATLYGALPLWRDEDGMKQEAGFRTAGPLRLGDLLDPKVRGLLRKPRQAALIDETADAAFAALDENFMRMAIAAARAVSAALDALRRLVIEGRVEIVGVQDDEFGPERIMPARAGELCDFDLTAETVALRSGVTLHLAQVRSTEAGPAAVNSALPSTKGGGTPNAHETDAPPPAGSEPASTALKISKEPPSMERSSIAAEGKARRWLVEKIKRSDGRKLFRREDLKEEYAAVSDGVRLGSNAADRVWDAAIREAGTAAAAWAAPGRPPKKSSPP